MDFLQLVQAAKVSMTESHACELLETNELSSSYGLQLTLEDAQELLLARVAVLKDYGRIEVNTEIAEKIITYFCPSPYIQQREYAETLIEIQELFHYIKNEVEDSLGDDELLQKLADLYNNQCQGVMELLKGRETEAIIRLYRFGDETETADEEELDACTRRWEASLCDK